MSINGGDNCAPAFKSKPLKSNVVIACGIVTELSIVYVPSVNVGVISSTPMLAETNVGVYVKLHIEPIRQRKKFNLRG